MDLPPDFDFQPRHGLPHTAARLARSAPVAIGYFGGSITQADGWRNGTFAWFQAQWPAVPFSQTAAAIGGTGSDLGVFRLDRDLLHAQPDLVFVEFAVNDANSPDPLILGAMEGIVRKIRLAKPETDILFVYTATDAMTADLRAGRYPRAAALHERVANHYGIPSIHMAAGIARLEGSGEWVFTGAGAEKTRLEAAGKQVFARDNCHPHPAGHALYTDAITRRLPALLKTAPAAPARPLPPPLSTGRWEQARMLSPAAVTRTGNWQNLPREQWPPIAWSAENLPELHLTDEPGASLECRFQGNGIGLYLVIGPACGRIEWKLDAQPPHLAPLFDAFCTYYRPHYQILASNLPEGQHTLRVRLLPDEPDKAAILAKRNETMDIPDRFRGIRFYLAALLLVGNPLTP